MRLLLVAVFLAIGCSSNSDSHKASVTVFAAASLTDALNELVMSFESQHPEITVYTHVGPTSLLARQIQQGAPADVFMAASPDWIDYLRENSLTSGPEVTFAENTLVVIGSHASDTINSLSELITMRRLAMADPSHVPAGVYGRQALQCAGIWDAVEPSVVPTLDVRGALTAVSSGAAEVAIVYHSDAALVKGLRPMFQLPRSCIPDIKYVAIALRDAAYPEMAAAFVAFVGDSTQFALWTRFGFNS
ncbi:MAG: molybdate ABC transporter substrate-binding protein [Rhodothermaceae bacterium]|nr:molybdate ABC transporter substrate-binding protein [Rhodothermaceae bacterium]MYI85125.1 molybdate ABC transporter substrate-binding protein [Rhodothermaceae bacterium]